MAEQVYEKAGTAIYTAKDGSAGIHVSWGPGYPPVDVPGVLGGRDPAEFERTGDDPEAGLIDAPEPEPEPEPPAEAPPG